MRADECVLLRIQSRHLSLMSGNTLYAYVQSYTVLPKSSVRFYCRESEKSSDDPDIGSKFLASRSSKETQSLKRNVNLDINHVRACECARARPCKKSFLV